MKPLKTLLIASACICTYTALAATPQDDCPTGINPLTIINQSGDNYTLNYAYYYKVRPYHSGCTFEAQAHAHGKGNTPLARVVPARGISIIDDSKGYAQVCSCETFSNAGVGASVVLTSKGCQFNHVTCG